MREPVRFARNCSARSVAMSRALRPSGAHSVSLAPHDSSSCITSIRPLAAACIRHVTSSSFAWSTSAPASISRRIGAGAPPMHAYQRAVAGVVERVEPRTVREQRVEHAVLALQRGQHQRRDAVDAARVQIGKSCHASQVASAAGIRGRGGSSSRTARRLPPRRATKELQGHGRSGSG
jgi:hypothetical protein